MICFSPCNGRFSLGALCILGSLINRHLRNCREAFNMHQITFTGTEIDSVSSVSAVCIPPS